MKMCNIKKVSLHDKNFFVKEVYPYTEGISDLTDEGNQAHIILRDNYPLLIVACDKQYYLITPKGPNRNVADLLGLSHASHQFRFQVDNGELILSSVV